MRTIAGLFLTATVLTGPAAAQTGAVEGPGSLSCQQAITSRAEDRQDYLAIAAWVSGFLSAANAYEEDTHDLTPWQSIELTMAQIDAFCQQQPEARVVEATVAYLSYLRPNRMVEAEDQILIENAGQSLAVYPSVIDSVRAALTERDALDAGGSGYDGEMIEALTAYQATEGLPQTGLPDSATLSRLLQQPE